MRLKSRNEFPINGWAFYEPATGWSANPHMGFTDVVKEIIAHRQANPRFNLATDVPSVSNELEAYTVSRLMSINGGRDYLLDDGGAPPPSFPSRRPLRERVADAAAGSARKLVVGISTMRQWLGDGLKPVPNELAETRASICTTCDRNEKGKSIIEAGGEVALRLIEAANGMNLRTSHDSSLGVCGVCSCVLRLKIFSPIKHILENQTSEIAEALPPHCWIKTQDAPKHDTRSVANKDK